MGPRLRSWNLYPIDTNSTIARVREELSPAQKKDLIFLIPKVKEIFLTKYVQKVSLEVKKGGASPHSK